MRIKLGPAVLAGVVATSLIGIGGSSAAAATRSPQKRACHSVRVRSHSGEVHHRRVCAKPKKKAPPAPQPSYTYPTAPAAYVPPAQPVATPAAVPPPYTDDHPAGDDYTTPAHDYGTPADDSYGDDYGNGQDDDYGDDAYGSSYDDHGDDRGDDRGDDGDRHGGHGRD